MFDLSLFRKKYTQCKLHTWLILHLTIKCQYDYSHQEHDILKCIVKLAMASENKQTCNKKINFGIEMNAGSHHHTYLPLVLLVYTWLGWRYYIHEK